MLPVILFESMAGQYYFAYGLRIHSQLPIRELLPGSSSQSAEVTIRWQREDETPAHWEGKPWLFEVGAEQAQLYFKDVGAFTVSLPGSIIVQPSPGVASRMVERYLSGIVLAVLLYLRGCLVFHAAACRIAHYGAALFIGDSGAGKSTLAAAAHSQGLPFMTDDVAALAFSANGISLLPAYPRLKVDPGTAAILHFSETLLEPVDISGQELYLRTEHSFPVSPAPLAALFFLRKGDKPAVRKLSKRELMLECIRNTVPTRLLQQPGDEDHFFKCSALTEGVPAYSLTRSSDFNHLENLVALVRQKCCR